MSSLHRIRIPELWAAGLRGDNVHIGVIGTGIDITHPDFVGKQIDAFSVTNDDVYDYFGHETGVAWLLSRIAPQSHITVVKDKRRQEGSITDTLDACEALNQLHVDLVNLSMASKEPSDGADPLSREVNHLVGQGIVVVAAAGNRGPRRRTIGTPGAAAEAITVGKVNTTDSVTRDSSRGPTLDGRLKPDCVAPGSDIIAAIPNHFRGRYGVYTCTSFAAPHVAGIIALLKQANPDFSPALLKQAIIESCEPATIALSFHQNDPYATGAGRANGLHAYQWLKKNVEETSQEH
jgi:serine protease AprX